MRTRPADRRRRTTVLAGSASSCLLAAAALLAPAAPAAAAVAEAAGPAACVEDPHAGETAAEHAAHAGPAAAARGGRAGVDHRAVDAAEQRAVAADVERRLAARGQSPAEAAAVSAEVPVHVHVMRDAQGGGDVTDAQIVEQIAVLNKAFAGGYSSEAAQTGFTFRLASIDRYSNTQWHQDRQSSSYRKKTRKGGAGALNMWLVDFDYLGIATFPWDYARNPGVDGIRVNYRSLPGGEAANYDLGQTATHEAGHWFGLFHTFQGGCTTTNDEVADTPAQSSATSGCPEGRDSCDLPGLDPVRNFMDYSFDACYDQFTQGQADRAGQMWTAYRA